MSGGGGLGADDPAIGPVVVSGNDLTRRVRELGAEIEQAIGRLRPEYRQAIVLRHIEDLPYEEIAQIMALPLGTVKTRLRSAMATLREALS